MPITIWLYRRPILITGMSEPLGAFRHVLIQIGHHFGLSDDDMEAIEALVEISRHSGGFGNEKRAG
jgi:predicted Zn-dependent protease with MMP-like domain